MTYKFSKDVRPKIYRQNLDGTIIPLSKDYQIVGFNIAPGTLRGATRPQVLLWIHFDDPNVKDRPIGFFAGSRNPFWYGHNNKLSIQLAANVLRQEQDKVCLTQREYFKKDHHTGFINKVLTKAFKDQNIFKMFNDKTGGTLQYLNDETYVTPLDNPKRIDHALEEGNWVPSNKQEVFDVITNLACQYSVPNQKGWHDAMNELLFWEHMVLKSIHPNYKNEKNG